MYQLRDYQINICKKLGRAINTGKRRILLSAPTGAGKTVIFTDFSKKIAGIGMNTLILVDRVELLKQTAKWGTDKCRFGVLKPDEFSPNIVTVAMLQTLRSRLKSENYQDWLSSFDVVFIDECHQMINGSTYQMICDFTNENCSIVGTSATPWDSRGFLLGGFDEFINEVEIRDLIEQGYLVKPVHLTVDLFDFSNVKVTSTGDYDSGAIDDIVVNTDKMDKVFSLWSENARHKKTLAFCSTVESAEQYAKFFRLNGIRAKAVSAKTSELEREQALIDFKEDRLDILFNCGLFVAGYDEPTVMCVMFLNPTKVKRKYIQCGGRGLRLCPERNKTECLILDFVGNSFRHLELDAIQSYIPAPDKSVDEEYDQLECPACGFVFDISEKECPECGFKLDFDDGEGGSQSKPKNKKEFERLIKLKSVQKELHDVIYEFAGLPCLIKIEETGKLINSRPEKKWCYGYREDGTPIFKTSKDYDPFKNPYPVITNAKKTNCWYVFHEICIKYNPKLGALRYYGKKLRKARAFLEQIKDEQNRAFVNLYKLMN